MPKQFSEKGVGQKRETHTRDDVERKHEEEIDKQGAGK